MTNDNGANICQFKAMVQWMATKQLKNTLIFMKINTRLWRNQFTRENIIWKTQTMTNVINKTYIYQVVMEQKY